MDFRKFSNSMSQDNDGKRARFINNSALEKLMVLFSHLDTTGAGGVEMA